MGLIFTFIGTIIGAGFASGQEIKLYFANFGLYGAIGLIFVSLFFMFVGEKIMLMGYKRKAESYDEILGYGFRCKFKKVIDYCLCFFLVATASTMFSGAGAFFNQFFGLNLAVGSFIITIITFFIVILGIKGIMKVSTFIVPILILLTCVIAISSILDFNIDDYTLINEVRTKNTFSALISGIIYGAYNIIMGLSVLPSLGSSAKSEKHIKVTAIFSGLIIGIFGFIIYFALLANYDKIQGVEIPIAVLSGNRYSLLYSISFIIAVLTTAVGCLYGVFMRFNKNVFIFGLICITAYFISLFGFSVLVSKLYYIMGIFGVFLIFMLLRGYSFSMNKKFLGKK